MECAQHGQQFEGEFYFKTKNNKKNMISQFDKHIAYNKNEKRPYIGVVLIVENHYYFAPLFSPKQKHKTYKDNFKVLEKNLLFKVDFLFCS